jgi:amino acid transporter
VTALLGGLGILAILLCHAEVASRFQDAGGTYLYAREAFGRGVGFQAGWLSFWIRVTSMAANLNVFVDYLAQLIPVAGTAAGRAVTMCAVTALVTALNVVGVRQGSRTVDAFTVAKLLPLVLLAALGLPRIRAEVLATQAVAVPTGRRPCCCWSSRTAVRGRAHPRQRSERPAPDSAFALLVALAVIASVYALVQLAVVGLVPHAGSVRRRWRRPSRS